MQMARTSAAALSMFEAARLLGLTYGAVRYMVKVGHLVPVHQRPLRLAPADVLALAKAREGRPRTGRPPHVSTLLKETN
jgi:hypothetical protein